MTLSAVRVRFHDFWPGFDPEHFFLPLLQGACPERLIEVSDEDRCDVELVSVFPRPGSRVTESPSGRARVSLWHTGENVRPPVGAWDLTLSFDPDSHRMRNAYLPLWWRLFPELLAPIRRGTTGENRLGRVQVLDDYLAPRVPTAFDRPKFACAFIRRPEPMRMAALRALRELGDVDVYGPLTGRPVAAKADIARGYRFVLCFENDAYPGYVTEKVVDAWGTGAIPLWWGLDPHRYINADAVVNLSAHTSLDDFCATVDGLKHDRDRFESVEAAPLLVRRPSLDSVRRRIAALL